ncbi:MAG: hypothetical protein IKE70_00775 [Bacilli bacterium]|nr:hypothetical protein [Bacilli bacterium]
MEYSIQDFSNVLRIRNQIAFLDRDILLELYKDLDNYITFLDTFVVLTNIDSGFLLLSPDFVPRVQEIVELNRFNIHDSLTYDGINQIITYLNEVKGQSESYKRRMRIQYASFQEDIRGVSFSSNQKLVQSLGYDPYVMDGLLDYNLDDLGEDKLFLASINSFLELIPELFEDSSITNLVQNKMEDINNQIKFYQRDVKKLLKTTNTHYQNVLKNE